MIYKLHRLKLIKLNKKRKIMNKLQTIKKSNQIFKKNFNLE